MTESEIIADQIAWVKNAIRTAQSMERIECIGLDIGADAQGGAEYTKDKEQLAVIRAAWCDRKRELEKSL